MDSTDENKFMETGGPDDLTPEDGATIDRAELGVADLNAAGDRLARDLLAVRELRLYRRTCSSWAAWCDGLHFSKRTADRLCWLARCAEEMGPNGPTSEWAARKLVGIPVEKLGDLAAAFEVKGGMANMGTGDIDRLVREYRGEAPIRMMLTANKGVVPFVEAGVLKELRTAAAAIDRIKKLGVHAIPDHVKACDDGEREETFRHGKAMVFLGDQLLVDYDSKRDAPAQEQWPMRARGEMPLIKGWGVLEAAAVVDVPAEGVEELEP